MRHSKATPAEFLNVIFPDPQASAEPKSGRWFRGSLLALSLVAIIAAFCAPLLLAWSTGHVHTPYVAVGGLLPWSDASGWLHGLYYLLNTGELTDWTVRRPLHLTYLASLS